MITPKTLVGGLQFPEGPVVLSDGSVLLVEVAGQRITKVASGGTAETLAEMPGGPNGAAVGADGNLYVCNNGGFKWVDDEFGLRPVGQAEDYVGGSIQRVDLATGEVTTIYTECDGRPLRAPNDIYVDRDGGLWFTDLGQNRPDGRDHGAVYYAHADGSHISTVIYPMLTPNGIGMSPDESVLYVAETEGGRLWAFDINGAGEIARQPWPSPNGGRFIGGFDGFQRLDSLAVEADGNICVGTLVRGGITVYSPDGGLVDYIALPDRMCTNICFGGDDATTAFMTLSLSGKLASMDWPRPGHRTNF